MSQIDRGTRQLAISRWSIAKRLRTIAVHATLTVALFSITLLLASGTSSGAAGPSARVASLSSAAETPVTFDSDVALELGTDPVSVLLVSHSSLTWSVALTAQLTTEGTSSNRDVPLAPAEVRVPPGGTAAVVVGPAASAGQPSKGYIQAVATSPGQPASVFGRAISSPLTSKPAVAQWSALSVARAPWASTGSGDLPDLPLTSPQCGSVSNGTAYLASATGNVKLPYSCLPNSEGAEVRFDDSRVEGVGSYTGKLTVGSTDVSLALLRTAHWTWPLLAILIGFLLASAQHAWVNNYRPLRRTSSRLNLIGEEAWRNQKAFEEAAVAEPFRHYNFSYGATREVQRLQRQIDDLQPAWARRWLLGFVPWAREDDAAAYDAAQKEMSDLFDAVEAWPDMAAQLKELQTTVHAVAPYVALSPGLVARAKEILRPKAKKAGQVELEFAESKKLIGEVTDTTVALKLLPVAKELEQRLDEVQPGQETPRSDVPVFFAAQRKWRQAVAEMQEAKSAEALKTAGVDQLLTQSRRMVLQLTVPPTGQRNVPQSVGAGDVPSATGVGLLSALVALFPKVSGTPSTTTASIRPVDAIWLLVAVAIAAWTGLAALYVGKAWGSWGDFFTMFVWAFGTTAVLTPVLAGLQNLVAGPMPLKKESGGIAE